MKLVLASQGFTTQAIADGVAQLAGQPLDQLHVAVVNESYTGISPGHNDHWLINELGLLGKHLAGPISFVSLRAHDVAETRRRLEVSDLIYIVGGAQVALPKLLHERSLDGVLRDLAQSKIIMGTSAGANVLGKQITDRTYWQDQYGEVDIYPKYSCLGLVDFNILPHFGRSDRPERTREHLTPLLKDHPFPLCAVTDEQAVVYDEGKVSFLGGDPVAFGAS